MPPAAISSDDQVMMGGWVPACCAFDYGMIEVEAVEEGPTKKTTRILMIPGIDDSNIVTDDDKRNVSQFDYFTSPPSSLGGRCLADSFDSTDEIVENSNEAKLIQRIVEKRAAKSGFSDLLESGFQGQSNRDNNSPVRRSDSMSDINSVDSTDGFETGEAQELEYLDIFDQDFSETSPTAIECAQRESEMDDSHPKKYQPRLEDIMDQLCANTCVEFISFEPPLEVTLESGTRMIMKPKSVLRKPPKWTKSLDDAPQWTMSSAVAPQWTKSSEVAPQWTKSSEVAPVTGCACSYPSALPKSSRIRFKDVDIREFKMTLGNHPSATSGPPVMLDWEQFSPRKVLPLEKYENTRKPRRKRRHLKLSLQQRHNILVKERGFSFEEVKSAWQEALEVRKQRKETLERGYVDIGSCSHSWPEPPWRLGASFVLDQSHSFFLGTLSLFLEL